MPHVPIQWGARGHNTATSESAPSVVSGDRSQTFETYYSHPEHETTEEPVNWLRVPVEDKLWRPGL